MVRGGIDAAATPNVAFGGPTDVFRALQNSGQMSQQRDIAAEQLRRQHLMDMLAQNKDALAQQNFLRQMKVEEDNAAHQRAMEQAASRRADLEEQQNQATQTGAFVGRGGEFVPKNTEIMATPLQLPTPSGPADSAAGLPVTPTLRPPLTVLTPPKEGYQFEPALPSDQPGIVRSAPTAATLLNLKKTADQANWPTVGKDLADKFGLPLGAKINPTEFTQYMGLIKQEEKPPTGEFDSFFLPAWASSHGKKVSDLLPGEKIQAFREFKQDPEAKAAADASRALSDSLKQLQLQQQPTQDQAQQVAQDLVAHRIAPEQLSSMFGGFGAAGQNFKRMVYGAAKKLDPEFDFERSAAEYGLVKSPQFQNTVRYMDSVNESIPLVIQRANELANGNVRFVNGLANMGKDQLNDQKLKKFQTDALLVADEIAKILQGGGTGNGTSDAKLSQAAQIIKSTDSPGAIAAGLSDVQQLLGFRRKALTRGTYMENAATPAATPPAQSAGYVRTAVGKGGHKIGQKADGGWYDMQNGQRVQ